jgi:hypothetical protein
MPASRSCVCTWRKMMARTEKNKRYVNAALDDDGDVYGMTQDGLWECLTATTIPEYVQTRDLLEDQPGTRFAVEYIQDTPEGNYSV